MGTEYQFTPLSINGAVIVAGSIRAAYWDGDDPSPMTQARPIGEVESNIVGVGARDVRGQPEGVTWLLTVELSATTQADLDALRTVFNEDAGLVYLRCTDGAASPTTWRCAIRQLAPPQRVDVARFKIPLRAANPVWEEDTLTTDTKANQSGNSVAINLTNNGNRAARPKFTLTPNAVKT